MRYIELFAGIGGMGHGLMQAGMECAGYCEIDKFAHQAFQILHDPEERMWNAYDVRSVTDDDIRLLGRERGPIQLIAGGFPCQSFSIAGKRKGFTDTTRGTLFFEIIRFASILRPEYILLENVTGLLSHDEGRTFETVIGTLDELGYVGEWCVLNSSAYVPQNRERVFIVASLRESGRRKIFPFGAEIKCNAKQFSQGEGVAYCLDTGYTKGISENSMDKGRRTHVIQPIGHLDVENPNQNTIVYDANGISPTLRNQHGYGTPKIFENFRIRKLTPLECFRLQSFPDWWYYKLKDNGISDSQLYKMAGNAVTSKVSYEIGKRIMN